MGFNFGIAAGAAAQAGMSTYERLEEQKLRQLQRSQLEKDIAEKEALDQAWRETQGRVGQQDEYSQAIKSGAGVGTEQAQALSTQGALRGNTAEDQAFERASAEAAVGAMRENAAYNKAGNTGYAAPAEGERAPQAALPEMKPTEYTSKQGMQDYLKAASQVSRKGTLEAIQMKGVVRESENQDKFDNEMTKLNDTLAKIQGTAESGGLKGLYEAGKQEGLKLNFVEGKNGVGSRIQVLGPKGDVLETVSDIGTATQKLSDAAMNQFMQKSVGLLGSPDKVIAAMQGERKINISQQEADTKQMVGKAQAGYYGAAASNLSAKANTFMDKLPEKEKFRLNSLNSSVQVNEKAYTANPTPEGQLSLAKAKIELNKALVKNGVLDNVYEGTGVPAPQEAASAILGAKVKPKDFNNYIANARKDFGRDYADELKLALNMSTPAKPAAINTAPEKSAVNLPRGQAAQQISPRVKAALDFEKRQKADAQ